MAPTSPVLGQSIFNQDQVLIIRVVRGQPGHTQSERDGSRSRRGESDLIDGTPGGMGVGIRVIVFRPMDVSLVGTGGGRSNFSFNNAASYGGRGVRTRRTDAHAKGRVSSRR